MIKSVSSILFYVEDIDKTFDFYTLLGFNTQRKKGMTTVRANWFELNFIDKSTAEINKEADLEPKGAGVFTYIKVSDVDDFYNLVVKTGIVPSSKPRNWAWGNREFVVKDPDGYKLVFFNKTK